MKSRTQGMNSIYNLEGTLNTSPTNEGNFNQINGGIFQPLININYNQNNILTGLRPKSAAQNNFVNRLKSR